MLTSIKNENSINYLSHIIFLLFVISFSVRFYFYVDTELKIKIRGDAAHYVSYAKNLIDHHTFSKDTIDSEPDSFWSPGYPTFIAINMKLSELVGSDFYNTTIIFQLFLGSIVVVLTFLLGNMFLNIWWSLLASLLTLFSPHLISYSALLISETLFSFLLISAIYFFCQFLNKNRTYLILISSLLFGLAYLTNQVLFFYPLLIVMLLFFIKKITLKKMIPFLLVYFMIVFSWSIRNSISVEGDSLNSSNRLLTNLVIGMHSDYHEIWRKNPRDPSNPADLDLVEFNGSYGLFLSALSQRIMSSPLHYLKWYLIEKPINLWGWDIAVGYFDVFVFPVFTSPYHKNILAQSSHKFMKSIHYGLFSFACLCAILGVYCWKNTKIEVLLIILSVVYISAVYVVTQADSRYSVPLRPEMYLLAMYFLQLCKKWIFSNKKKNDIIGT